MRRKIGDRYDGRRVRSLDPMNRVSAFIMPTRIGSSNIFRSKIDMTELDKYIRRKRKEGFRGFGILHLFIAAYVRTVSQRPAINRFIAGQECFARNDIVISLAVKKSMDLHAQETVVKANFTPWSTANDVYDILNGIIQANRAEGDQTDFDRTARILNYIPNVVLRFLIGCLRFMDYFGILPRGLEKVSPFHASLFITSMGSLGIPPIVHHLYDFGNVPVFISYGTKSSEYVIQKDGSAVKKTFVEFTVNTDERICDGFYFASAAKMFYDLLTHPDQLDNPPDAVVEDDP